MEEQGRVRLILAALVILKPLAVDFGRLPHDKSIFFLNGGKRFKKFCGSDLVALRLCERPTVAFIA
jgi:hypothetical protein